MACKIGQSVPWRSSLHLLPTQVLHHIAGHNPNSNLIAREDGWVGQAGVCLWVPAFHAVQLQGGLRKDSMVVYITNGWHKYHLAVGSSTVQEAVYPLEDLSQAQQELYECSSSSSFCGLDGACGHMLHIRQCGVKHLTRALPISLCMTT